MDDAVLGALLLDVKNHLDVTWADAALESKLRIIIRLGIAYLDSKLGEPGDYTADGYPRMLLFEYVRYARDGALDVFECNYKSMILAMQNERRVRDYAKNAVSAQ